MAWFRVDSELATHVKLNRLTRALKIPTFEAVGVLVVLWAWCKQHRPSGDLHGIDADDLAAITGWTKDPQALLDALTEAHSDRSGFIDWQPNGTLSLHDWEDYQPDEGNRAAIRSERAMVGAHVRHHVKANLFADGCPLCQAETQDLASPRIANYATAQNAMRPQCDRNPIAMRPQSDRNATAMRPQSDSNATAIRDDAMQCESNATAMRKLPTSTSTSTSISKGLNKVTSNAKGARPTDVDAEAEDFEERFWSVYPARNGKKLNKGQALIEWRKLSKANRDRAVIGATNLAASGQYPKDAFRFLRKTSAGTFHFDDWQQLPTTGDLADQAAAEANRNNAEHFAPGFSEADALDDFDGPDEDGAAA